MRNDIMSLSTLFQNVFPFRVENLIFRPTSTSYCRFDELVTFAVQTHTCVI